MIGATTMRRPGVGWLLVVSLTWAIGCGGGASGGDAPEAISSDAIRSDTGSPDANTPDATSPDIIPSDGASADAATSDTSGLATCRATPGCACNGYPQLCDRRLDQVVFPAAHNAMNNKADGWLFPNQNRNMAQQLKDGVRGFLIDTHEWTDPDDPSTTSWLCHGSCQLGKIKLVDALAIFRAFLDTHPDEVLIFVVEDKLAPAKFVAAMDAADLTKYAMTYKIGTDFLTLRDVIKSGKRLLVTTEQKGGPPAWLHRFNDLGFDTPYAFKTMAALRADTGPEDSCRKFRGTAGAPIFLMNHWVAKVLPAPMWSKQANAKAEIVKRAKRCAKLHGRLPTLVAVDHYDLGDVFGAVRELNGL